MPSWRSIPGFPTYHVSDEGLVRGVKPRPDGLPAVPVGVCATRGGRRRSNRVYVKLYDVDGRRRTLALGPLVLRSFGIMPPSGRPHEVAYRDRDARNNALNNLCWVPKTKFVRRHGRRGAA